MDSMIKAWPLGRRGAGFAQPLDDDEPRASCPCLARSPR